MMSQFAPDSFQQIFFQEQLKYNSLKKKSSMRWHPTMIRWCLFIKSKSAKAYEGMRSFLSLPSNRTLFDYSHYMESDLGVNPRVVEQLIVKANKLGCYDELHKSYVGLLHDEIKIKADLVYKKNTGELIGYVNLDNVTNELLLMEDLVGKKRSLAEYMFVTMVRGITTNLCYPLASYATKAVSAASLYTIVWECVEYVETVVGLKVLYICCDGAVQNRKFFQLHCSSEDVIVHETSNLYAIDDARDLYFISDPPHLLKTTRNCFANSFASSKVRHLWFEQDISWMHVVRLFEEHCEKSEFKLCPKLTRNHIDLTSFSKMRVSLAANVLSSTVANALDLKYGSSVSATVKFVRLMNKWFDIVNVKHIREGRNSRNPDLMPFTDINDPRII